MARRESEWLVDYEHAHGRTAEAWRLATEAAGTGSQIGVETLAGLSERTGAIDKAEALYRKAAERYGSHGSLLAFYLRAQGRGDGRNAVATAALLSKLFPQGLQRVAIADFATGAAPDKGLTVEGPKRRLEAAGLRENDVLVAVDGYRVRDYEQWRVVSELSRDPAMTFIAYRDGRYVAANGRFPGRRITKQLRPWVRPGPPPAPPRASR